MSSLVRAFLTRPRIEIGSTWRWDEGNPFDQYTVEIVSIKGGWVQYRLKHGTLSSCEFWVLRWLYKPVPKECA